MNDVQASGPVGSTTQSFGAMAVTQGTESAAAAVAAQAKAQVEARYVMALRCPRNWDQVRQDIVRECQRPSFAQNKSTYYRKPIGEGVEGLGIRFVESALRHMRNVLVETTTIFEDDIKEIHRVSVTDLESNITYPLDVRVSKTVERSRPMEDGSYISVRKNSKGYNTYTIPGTDDDILNKRQALISKAIRSLGLRIIPGDIQDEARETILSIRMDAAAKDPDRHRKILADLFAEVGVKAADLAEYLGHDLGTCSPKEIVELRAIHGAISDGEATWAEVMDNKALNGTAKKSDATKTLPPYPAEDFNANLPTWLAAIANGQATADAIISRSSSRYTLSEEQKAAIRQSATEEAGGVVDTEFTKAYEQGEAK